jgi:c-di-GMP-related signal transduction protein
MFEDILEKSSLNHNEKVVLSVIRTLNELVEKGILSEGPFTFPDPKKVDEILGDFQPTEDEIRDTIIWMKSKGYMQ